MLVILIVADSAHRPVFRQFVAASGAECPHVGRVKLQTLRGGKRKKHGEHGEDVAAQCGRCVGRGCLWGCRRGGVHCAGELHFGTVIGKQVNGFGHRFFGE